MSTDTMAGATDLIVIFLGLEVMSIAVPPLAFAELVASFKVLASTTMA